MTPRVDAAEGMSVTVVIPTLNRHRALARALASVLAQQIPDGADTLDVVVVDNSVDHDASAVVAGLAAGARLPVTYLSVPQPGVATARNAGVAAASGRWVAFLDDDEEAPPGWLGALAGVARGGGFDAVFGPIRAAAESGEELGPMAAYFSRSLARQDGADITGEAAYLGTNNSMFRRAALLSVEGPFEPSLNSVGGEDSLLLQRLVMAGRRLGWSAGAGITEWVPPRRTSWAYIRKRKFLSGQIRTFVNTMVVPPRRRAVLLWMAVGAVQVAAAGTGALLLLPIRRAASRQLSATVFGGLGKLFWMRRFRPSLYGHGLVS